MKIVQKEKQTWLMFSKSPESIPAHEIKFDQTIATNVKEHPSSAVCGALRWGREGQAAKKQGDMLERNLMHQQLRVKANWSQRKWEHGDEAGEADKDL